MSFKAQAKILRVNRIKSRLSQGDVADILGYRSAQFVSNIERGLAGIPEKELKKWAIVLKVRRLDLFNAVMDDHSARLRKALGL